MRSGGRTTCYALSARICCLLLIGLSACMRKADGVNGRLSPLFVETSLGRVEGSTAGAVNEYLGIPFAEPPIGKLRFRPPVPKRPWFPATLSAKNFRPECLQSSLFVSEDGTERDENCLYLNVWQPAVKLTTGKLWPVLVWIYGGAFIHGGSSKLEYNGRFLAEKGSIIVSFNYRLGALGFLVSTADGLFGNYGLADQQMALHWIHTNIKAFGGDPSQITIFGESAGAMSAGLHMIDLMIKDPAATNPDDRSYPSTILKSHRPFQAVIMQSNPLGYKYRSVAVANFLGEGYKEQLDCEDLHCLQSESAEELIHVQDTMMAMPRSIGDFFTWTPVITDAAYQRELRYNPGAIFANVSVLQPLESLALLRSFDIPVLMGTNAHEGNMFVFTAFPTRMNRFVFQAVLFSFFREFSVKVSRTYSGLLEQVSRQTLADYRTALAQIVGDYLFRCPNQWTAKKLQTLGTSAFLYQFSLPTRVPGFEFCNGLACHTSEIPFVFGNLSHIRKSFAWTAERDAELFHSDHGNSSSDDNCSSVLPGVGTRRESISLNENDRHQPFSRVSNQMSSFWINFALRHDPNNNDAGDSWTPVLGKNSPKMASLPPSTLVRIRSPHRQFSVNGASNVFGIHVAPRKQFIHQWVFNAQSRLVLIDNDCICNFWDEVGYIF